ncbi:VanZ family protein [Maribacter polysiphoniae]|uniref:VanZ family protein n=1 Tax=Maribacter polysiphoniae TaxID=429344 RepID=UPI002354B539|nr:VanZ family protein [Maribacter polysiphoniae]
MHKRHLFAILFIGWMVFVTFSSLYSFEGDDLPTFSIPYADKIVHFTFYFVAVILGSLYFLSLNNPWAKTLVKIIKLALLLVVFGMVIEVIQGTLTVNRSGDVFDAMANSTGVAVGFIIILSQFYGQRGLK